MTRSRPSLLLPDLALFDLHRFVSRARRLDPAGAIRLVGGGEVLALYVAPLFGAGGPTVLGLRVIRPAALCRFDLTTPLSALADLIAATGTVDAGTVDAGTVDAGTMDAGTVDAGTVDAGTVDAETMDPGTMDAGTVTTSTVRLDLNLPDAGVTGAAWAGVTPPRRGWEPVGQLDSAALCRLARAGAAEIVAATPPTAGAAQLATLRARVWGRPLSGELAGPPAGAAFVAHALAFLDDAEPVAVYRRHPWTRLTTSRGHVLARPPLLPSGP
jgi:hypothetical protein